MRKGLIYPVVLLSAGLVSCVPQRKYEELQVKYDDCQGKKSKAEESLFDCENNLNSTTEKNKKLNEDVKRLQIDSLECTTALDKTKRLHADKDKLTDEIIANSKDENARIKADLNARTEALKDKEKELNDKEAKLMDVQKRNNGLETDLAKASEDLKKREARVAELEAVLRAKDSAVLALKNNLAKALLGFKDNGLTVEVKNGKVYVSMEEKLLFKSASIVVDPKGEQALLELAKALNNQPDVSVLVEGHTDDVPMKSGQIKDNWDLSVLRATSIVRILTEKGKVAQTRLVASGRGESMPIDAAKTPEARTKNRRTEIILTPKLDELFKILGN